ncbi:MAG: TlpA disulfide reductase family protein [Gammaproteobacteria bacterium]|nr:TlpA disulfide reductase family protein [Gammaproteobacteria bacterium]
MNTRNVILIVIVGVIFGLVGFYAGNFIGGKVKQPVKQATPKPTPTLVETLPDFEFKTLDGKTVTLADYEGKALVVNFWATWCAPCRKEIPLLVEMQEKYAEQDIQLLGVAIDNEQAIRKFIAQIGGVNYPILFSDLELTTMEWAQKKVGVDLIGLPITVTTDHNGRILTSHPGEVDEAEALMLFEEILAARETGSTE